MAQDCCLRISPKENQDVALGRVNSIWFEGFKACDALNDTQCVSLGLKHVIIINLKCIYFLRPKENSSVKSKRVSEVKTRQAPQNTHTLAYLSKYRSKSWLKFLFPVEKKKPSVGFIKFLLSGHLLVKPGRVQLVCCSLMFFTLIHWLWWQLNNFPLQQKCISL